MTTSRQAYLAFWVEMDREVANAPQQAVLVRDGPMECPLMAQRSLTLNCD